MHIALPFAITPISLFLFKNIKNKTGRQCFPSHEKIDIWLASYSKIPCSGYIFYILRHFNKLFDGVQISYVKLCLDVLHNKDNTALQDQLDRICNSAFKNEILLPWMDRLSG